LIAFAIGLASVWFSDAYKFGVWEAPVELPETQAGTILVKPIDRVEDFSIRIKLEDGYCITIPGPVGGYAGGEELPDPCADSPTLPCDETAND
jgi:hypothetical protein